MLPRLQRQYKGELRLKPRNALIGVFDKTGIEELCRCFSGHDIIIYATGKTSDFLRSKGIEVKPVSSLTGFNELLDGRVKTLHPAIFSGILALRDDSGHMKQLEKLGFPPFDIVVSNLYPFEQALSEQKHVMDEMLELIDIGGVAITRAAAKNYRSVAIVTDIGQYHGLEQQLDRNGGELDADYLKLLAVHAFERTAAYDADISTFLRGDVGTFGDNLIIHGKKGMDLKYGENPFQRAAAYKTGIRGQISVINAIVEGGKELSFNNILDLDIALEMTHEFSEPCAIVVKHANPSGVGVDSKQSKALEFAYESDAVSAYGCVIGLNRKMDLESANFLRGKFVDAIIAPGYDKDAMQLLSKRKKLRILTLEGMENNFSNQELDLRRIRGGYLAQTTGVPELSSESILTVTKRRATEEELAGLLFGWKVVRYLWSNAIVLSRSNRTVGIGAGQSSRVDAVRIAIEKSLGNSKGSVMASDAFFPFRDGLDEAAAGGVTAVIQPGGSIRDEEVIASADEHNIAMLFTGQRLFRH